MNPSTTRTGPRPYQDPVLIHIGISRDAVLRMTGHMAPAVAPTPQRVGGKPPIPAERLAQMRTLLAAGRSCRQAARMAGIPDGSARYCKRLLAL